MTTTALRAWERRYRLLTPVRTAGGQRLYSLADVARVQRVQQLVETGWTVAAAAERVSGDDEEDVRPAPAPPRDGLEDVDVAARRRMLDALGRSDPFLLLAAYETTSRLLRASDVTEVSAALQHFVRRVGGDLGEAAVQDDYVLPVDLALGSASPLLPRAERGSVARMRLEVALPLLVEDARVVAHRLVLGGPDRASVGVGGR